MKRLGILFVTALTIVAMFFTVTAHGSSPLGLVNAERSAAGLTALTEDPALSSYAASHASAMASSGDIYHSSSAALQSAPSQTWTKLGENVGRGESAASLHEAFMNSAAHRANILGADYTHVGYAYTTSDGVTYTAWVFAAYESEPKPTTTTTTTPAATQDAPTTTTAPRTDSTPEAENEDDICTRPYLRTQAYPL